MEIINTKKTAVLILLFVLLAIVGYFLVPKFYNKKESENYPTKESEKLNIPIINAEYSFKNGVHTYTGGIALPTPCHELSTSVENDKNNLDKVVIKFEAINPKESCIQIITEKFFNVSFGAKEGASVSATLNGSEVRFNLMKGGSIIDKG